MIYLNDLKKIKLINEIIVELNLVRKGELTDTKSIRIEEV